ncbi:MAG: prephenate dehydratase [Alphaproteobacteria bacterium]|nr:prephenate dehydratase [Alphaproteobacteria bacterium]
MLKITFQGTSGAYSHIACCNLFPDAYYIASDTFEEAMEMVENDIADYAVIPVENSNAGRVADVHFLLSQTGLSIVGEYFLRVEHQLLGLSDAELSDISVAASHPQALAQCSGFLKKHSIKAIGEIDTAKSCERIVEKQDKTKAAIASKLAGEIYGLKVLASNIENDINNTTRFLVMKKTKVMPMYDGGVFITSLLFKVKHIPSALYKALGGFATNGLNLNKIESYVVDGNFVSAQFYVEVEAHPYTKEYKNALEELEFYSQSVTWLGTYKKCIK